MPKFTISQISHVSFLIKDLDKALYFYCNILGLVAKDTRPKMSFRGAWLTINESQEIHLLELPNPDPIEGRPEHGGRDRHAAFFVDQFDALKQCLEENNIDYTLSHSGRAALFFRDVDGNALEFIATI
ncbi:MAG: VOC family protein [Thiotrichaceae bacterium]|nr:VOC family protein [Thiotrichaceae bacterium]